MIRNTISLGLLTIATLGACSADVGDADDTGTATQAVVEAMASENLNLTTADSVSVSTGSDRLDLLTIENGNLRYRPYAHSTGWRTPIHLSKPEGVESLKTVTAVANGLASRIDAFAVGANNKIYHRYKRSVTDTDWSAWFQIMNHPTVRAQSALAATSWSSGRIDLFWWTPSGNLGHAWADNNQWAGTESGDTASATHLQVPQAAGSDLTAVSWGPNRIDLFYVSGSWQLGHHWFGGGWGPRETFNLHSADHSEFVAPTSVAVASRGANKLEVFARALRGAPGSEIYRATFSGSWPLVPGVANTLKVDLIGHNATATPNQIDTAVAWNGGSRMDLFGDAGDRLWHAFK